jgi:hypothetical protein
MLKGKLNSGVQNMAVIIIAVIVIITPFNIGEGIIT